MPKETIPEDNVKNNASPSELADCHLEKNDPHYREQIIKNLEEEKKAKEPEARIKEWLNDGIITPEKLQSLIDAHEMRNAGEEVPIGYKKEPRIDYKGAKELQANDKLSSGATYLIPRHSYQERHEEYLLILGSLQRMGTLAINVDYEVGQFTLEYQGDRMSINSGESKKIFTQETEIIVGSDERDEYKCDYRIANNGSISRRHLKIALRDRGLYICDLYSANGTFYLGRNFIL